MNRTNVGANTNVLHILLDVFVVIASLGLALLAVGHKIPLESRNGFLCLVLVFGVILISSNRTGYLYNVTMFCYLDRMIRTEYAEH